MKKVAVGTPEKNLEERVLVQFLLDNSSSMEGNPIKELNKGMQLFLDEVRNDDRLAAGLDIGIVVFDSGVRVVQEPVSADDIEYVNLNGMGGTTSLNGAIQKAFEINEQQKIKYKENGIPYKRGWIIPITDGAPTDGDVSENSRVIEAETQQKKYCVLPIGVDGADMNTLNKLAGYMENQEGVMVKTSALPMQSTNFSGMFKWLSASLKMDINNPGKSSVQLPDATDWLKGFQAS